MKRSSTIAAILAVTALSTHAFAANPNSDYTGNTSQSWSSSMIGPGTLSLKESKIAVDKASNAKVREFAKFEVSEQNALGTVLKELQAAEPEMSDKDMATLRKLQDLPKGPAFDKAYIDAQIEGHKVLSNVNSSFLNKADASSSNPMEAESRHLAMVVQPTITQHIANTSELAHVLKR